MSEPQYVSFSSVVDHYENVSERENAVIAAAREWRRVYLAWVNDPLSLRQPRDLAENGENRALSDLLDALDELDGKDAP